MNNGVPIFPPDADSHPVSLIERKLSLPHCAISIPYEAVAGARELFCFQNVRAVVEQRSGEIVYGWDVWQHGGLFVEAEHHAVWRKPTGELVCVTPQTPQEKAVTFIPDPSAIYDWNARHTTHNVRIALVNDRRMLEFFKACEEQTDIMNAAEHIGDGNMVSFKRTELMRHQALEMRKAKLMTGIIESVGRNALCPCGSGKKYKKCHGA